MNMKKVLNKFLNKKSDFIEDPQLSALNEQFFYAWEKIHILLNFILPLNIKYFLRFKKLYLAKLLLVITIYFGLFCGVIGAGLFTLDYFNVISISKAIPKVAEKVTIYLPDSDVASIAKLSKQFNVVIFFPPDPNKDWKLYKHKVHMIESNVSDSASYHAFSTMSVDGKVVEYWGKYQLGPLARKIAGLGNITFERFASNPEMQEGAFLEWIKFIKTTMQPDILKYSGKFYDGVQITESGIISMAHNAGAENTRAYLARGNKPPGGVKFLKIGGYNLNFE
jgi:hypothetical protein